MATFGVLPYNPINIDSSYNHFFQAVKLCLTSKGDDRSVVTSELESLWTKVNPNYVLPCLSVRSGLDLFLQAMSYPQGSEIIMTAINVQGVADVIRHQSLKVISMDIHIKSLEPKMSLLENLITRKTVAIFIAHLYGRWIDMEPVITIAEKYGLHVIEDCAESFCGFSRLGHAKADITLFSFGVIKYSTSFGGAVVKVRERQVWTKMKDLHSQYPMQSNQDYLKKVMKFFMLYNILYLWPIPHLGQAICRYGYDPKDIFVKFIRSFPSELISSIRVQPSPALLSLMLYIHKAFDKKCFDEARLKGEYFLSRLTPYMYAVGTEVAVNNYWLFPVLVKNPQEVVKCLNSEGMAAYRGSTQLRLIDGDNTGNIHPSPWEASYLMNHVIYLPVNKHVPFDALEKMTEICSRVMNKLEGGASDTYGLDKWPCFIKSKL